MNEGGDELFHVVIDVAGIVVMRGVVRNWFELGHGCDGCASSSHGEWIATNSIGNDGSSATLSAAADSSGTTCLLTRHPLLLRPLLLRHPFLHILRNLPNRREVFLVQVVALHILLVLDKFHRGHHLAILARLVVDLAPSGGDEARQFEEANFAVGLPMFTLAGLFGLAADVPVGA